MTSFAAGVIHRAMSKVRAHITVTADGYVAGPNESLEYPGHQVSSVLSLQTMRT